MGVCFICTYSWKIMIGLYWWNNKIIQTLNLQADNNIWKTTGLKHHNNKPMKILNSPLLFGLIIKI